MASMMAIVYSHTEAVVMARGKVQVGEGITVSCKRLELLL